jgi:hypothetical protein
VEGSRKKYITNSSVRTLQQLLLLLLLLLLYYYRILLEKLTVTQLVDNMPAFYGSRRFITVFARACHWSLSWARWIQSTPSPPYFSEVHSDIILPSTPRSSEWCVSFMFSDQNFVPISHLSHECYMAGMDVAMDQACSMLGVNRKCARNYGIRRHAMRPLRRPRCRWTHNIKMGLREKK